MNYAGNYVSYYLNVEEAGDYNVILNVANGRAAFDFDPGMEVDGTKFPATINAKQTGDGEKNEWYNFENLEPVTVTLPKGHSILTLRASEKDKYPNIDYILVEKKQTATQSLKSAAAKKPVQPEIHQLLNRQTAARSCWWMFIIIRNLWMISWHS